MDGFLLALLLFGSMSGALPVAAAALVGTPEVIVSTTSSQRSTLAATSSTVTESRLADYFWRIAVGGSDDVYVAFGDNPTASAATGYLCPAGGVYEFRISFVGADAKVAVINA